MNLGATFSTTCDQILLKLDHCHAKDLATFYILDAKVQAFCTTVKFKDPQGQIFITCLCCGSGAVRRWRPQSWRRGSSLCRRGSGHWCSSGGTFIHFFTHSSCRCRLCCCVVLSDCGGCWFLCCLCGGGGGGLVCCCHLFSCRNRSCWFLHLDRYIVWIDWNLYTELVLPEWGISVPAGNFLFWLVQLSAQTSLNNIVLSEGESQLTYQMNSLRRNNCTKQCFQSERQSAFDWTKMSRCWGTPCGHTCTTACHWRSCCLFREKKSIDAWM